MKYYAYYNDSEQGLAAFLTLDGALEFIARRANAAGVLELKNYDIIAGEPLPLTVKSTVAVVGVDLAEMANRFTKADADKLLGKA